MKFSIEDIFGYKVFKSFFPYSNLRARSLGVSKLRSETMGFRYESAH